jgi:pyridoxine/pyridoxamine 5'-phosphate oxidase
VSQLWDICSKQPWEIHDREEVQDEILEYRPRFEEEIQKEIPTHPYKIYRNLVESQELTEKEKAALHHLKDEYTDKWEQKKRGENL